MSVASQRSGGDALAWDQRRQARLLVVNADDGGLHPAVNRGIMRAHREGIVTSTSLMACGRAFEDAVARVRECPQLGVGIHLTLVEEYPVLLPQRVPSLVDHSGCMPASYREFAAGWMAGRIRRAEVRQELVAQIERVLDAGIRPTHLDSHQHVHCLPGLWAIVAELAKAYEIRFVRVPRFDSVWQGARGRAEMVLRLGVNTVAQCYRVGLQPPLRSADRLVGTSVSGRMTAAGLRSLTATLRPGVTEIMLHPGEDDPDLRARYHRWHGFDWSSELQAALDWDVKESCRRAGCQLVHFGMLAD